jgi:hypothetical protein
VPWATSLTTLGGAASTGAGALPAELLVALNAPFDAPEPIVLRRDVRLALGSCKTQKSKRLMMFYRVRYRYTFN